MIQHSPGAEETPIPESIQHLLNQPIDVPRVRDVEAGEERPLQSYQAMKQARVPDELVETVLVGPCAGRL